MPTLPLVLLRDKVLFPGDFGPLFISRPDSLRALEAGGARVAVATQRVTESDEPRAEDIYQVGTLGLVSEKTRVDEDVTRIVLESKERIKIDSFSAQKSGLFRANGYFLVEATPFPDHIESPSDIDSVVKAIFDKYDELRRRRGLPPEALQLLHGAALDSGTLVPMALHYLAAGDNRHFIPLGRRQALLEAPSQPARLRLFHTILDEELARLA